MPTFTGTTAEDVRNYIVMNHKAMLEKVKEQNRFSQDIVTLPAMAQYCTTRRICGEYTLTENDTYRHFDDSVGAICDFDRRDYLFEIPCRTLIRKEYDNLITAGRTVAGEGYAWDVPPGIPHAPGSLCTYEPQFASDVYAMYQSVLYGGQCVPEELLWKDCPPEERGNFDYLMEVIDWQANTDSEFSKNRFMAPKVIWKNESGCEEWICYKCKEASAKRLTINPGQSVKVYDHYQHLKYRAYSNAQAFCGKSGT